MGAFRDRPDSGWKVQRDYHPAETMYGTKKEGRVRRKYNHEYVGFAKTQVAEA